ncbi:uncharacterized protein LOC107362778 [Tetranychus urticae]|uniref:uncharacterized protein LOC107362778 n=1 Tax=Tetranychus urticae TaxID=32264 RepID=UPI00077BE8F2|nr:uncharacterized protein LOC107362778 [Tetranychus urticae]XP_015785393.1 uncharacterized protein LOC107362778 [Tetranychus urticae]
MDSYNWDDYCGSKLKKVVDNLIKDSLTNLISLSQDQCLMTEIAIFRKNLEKISIRLRNAKVSSLLKKVRRLINQYLELNITEILEKECKVFLSLKYDGNKCIELPKGVAVITVMKELRHLADILDKICKYSSYAVSHCMLWLRLGHMIPHFVVALSTISRLNVICRALLIYVADLHGGLIEFCKICKNNELLDESDISIPDGPLRDLEAKCLGQLDDEEDILMVEDIGEALNRNDIDRLTSVSKIPQGNPDSELTKNRSKMRERHLPSLTKYKSFEIMKLMSRRTKLRKIKNKVNSLLSR